MIEVGDYDEIRIAIRTSHTRLAAKPAIPFLSRESVGLGKLQQLAPEIPCRDLKIGDAV